MADDYDPEDDEALRLALEAYGQRQATGYPTPEAQLYGAGAKGTAAYGQAEGRGMPVPIAGEGRDPQAAASDSDYPPPYEAPGPQYERQGGGQMPAPPEGLGVPDSAPELDPWEQYMAHARENAKVGLNAAGQPFDTIKPGYGSMRNYMANRGYLGYEDATGPGAGGPSGYGRNSVLGGQGGGLGGGGSPAGGAPDGFLAQHKEALDHLSKLANIVRNDPAFRDRKTGALTPHGQAAYAGLLEKAGSLAAEHVKDGQARAVQSGQQQYSTQQQQMMTRLDAGEDRLNQMLAGNEIGVGEHHDAMEQIAQQRQAIRAKAVPQGPTTQERFEKDKITLPDGTVLAPTYHANGSLSGHQALDKSHAAYRDLLIKQNPNDNLHDILLHVASSEAEMRGLPPHPNLPPLHGQDKKVKEDAAMSQKDYVAAEHTIRKEIDDRIHQQKAEHAKNPSYEPTLTDDMREQAIVQEKRNRGLGKDYAEYRHFQETGEWGGTSWGDESAKGAGRPGQGGGMQNLPLHGTAGQPTPQPVPNAAPGQGAMDLLGGAPAPLKEVMDRTRGAAAGSEEAEKGDAAATISLILARHGKDITRWPDDARKAAVRAAKVLQKYDSSIKIDPALDR